MTSTYTSTDPRDLFKKLLDSNEKLAYPGFIIAQVTLDTFLEVIHPNGREEWLKGFSGRFDTGEGVNLSISFGSTYQQQPLMEYLRVVQSDTEALVEPIPDIQPVKSLIEQQFRSLDPCHVPYLCIAYTAFLLPLHNVDNCQIIDYGAVDTREVWLEFQIPQPGRPYRIRLICNLDVLRRDDIASQSEHSAPLSIH